jgi:hypothetical protein
MITETYELISSPFAIRVLVSEGISGKDAAALLEMAANSCISSHRLPCEDNRPF